MIDRPKLNNFKTKSSMSNYMQEPNPNKGVNETPTLKHHKDY